MTEPNTKSALQIICNEPFRIFFPLGAGFAFIGVSHWLWYHAGLTSTYSCHYHGLIQIQCFEASFVIGFLMTALPRFLEVPSARPVELLIALALLVSTGAGLYVGNQQIAQFSFLGLIAFLIVFVAQRFPARKDTPPPEFLLIAFGLLHAISGSLLILYPIAGWVRLGERLLQQGWLLCLVMAIGSYLWPRLSGRIDEHPPGPPLPRAIRSCAAGLLLLISFWVEAAFSDVGGRATRASVVTLYLALNLPLVRFPTKPLWHLRFIQVAFWMVIAGLWAQTAYPDYDVVSLHLVFIGGFASLSFFIATRVICAHCGFEAVWERNHPALVIAGAMFLLAVLSRTIADFYLSYYFGMLHIGAAFWLIGAIVWAIVFVPKMTTGNVDLDEG